MLKILIGGLLVLLGCVALYGLALSFRLNRTRAAADLIVPTALEVLGGQSPLSLLLPIILIGGGIALIRRGMSGL